MKNTKRNLVFICILLVVTLTALTACNLNLDLDILKIDVANCDITLPSSSYNYTGQEITPNVTVKFEGLTLQKDVDYTVDYYDNVQIGTAQVKITGIGKYKGSVVKEFEIRMPDGKSLCFFFSAPGADFDNVSNMQYVNSVDELIVPNPKKLGYEFLYWTYDGRVVDFVNKINLPSSSAQFEAEFDLITYTVQYVLNGGTNDPANREEYTVEDVFELKDAKSSSEDLKFVGWYLDKDMQNKITSLSGVASDLTLYAKFADGTVTLSYVLPEGTDLNGYSAQTLYPGTELQRPLEVLSQDGSKKLVWYIDKDMSIRHNLRYMPDNDLTLYARWEDKVYAGFLDRDWYTISDVRSINSYEDMLAYVEFVLFYNLTDSTRGVRVTYESGKDKILEDIEKALTESTFPRMLSVNYRVVNNNIVNIYMASSNSAQATYSASDKKDYLPQIDHVFNNFVSSRSASFDSFAINYVENEYECTTSDQLFYVLSHGYRPVLASNTPAYKSYNQFKKILRSICDDSMTDLQKARAIFDWLVVNVYYDYNAAERKMSHPSYQYDAFYIEGVLNGSAVCDGLSKAYASMCAIEGIDCIRVTGKLKDADEEAAGHAWNKIQLMGQWFLSDTTWGNPLVNVSNGLSVNSYEYVNDKYFLFTDKERSEIDNYNSNQYSQYVADCDFNYHSNYKMQLKVSNKVYNFDLYIDGDSSQGYKAVDELSYVFEYIDKSGVSLEGTAVCVMLGEDMTSAKLNEALKLYTDRFDKLKLETRIKRYNIIASSDSEPFAKGSVITIVFSLPQSNSTSQKAA